MERIAIEDARKAAEVVVEMLRLSCEWIEICGSIRRGKAEVKDAEIVAISKDNGLGGKLLLATLDGLLAQGLIERAEYGEDETLRWGDTYRGIVYQGVRVEIFLATPENVGYQRWLRTGPGDANRFVMTMITLQNPPFRARDGYWWTTDTGERLIVRSEEDMFALLGMPYLPPNERTEERYKTLIRREQHRWGNSVQFVEAVEQTALLNPPTELVKNHWFDDATNADWERAKGDTALLYLQKHPVAQRTVFQQMRAEFRAENLRESIRREALRVRDARVHYRETRDELRLQYARTENDDVEARKLIYQKEIAQKHREAEAHYRGVIATAWRLRAKCWRELREMGAIKKPVQIIQETIQAVVKPYAAYDAALPDFDWPMPIFEVS